MCVSFILEAGGRPSMCAAFSNACYKREKRVDSWTHTSRTSLERNKMNVNYLNAKPKKKRSDWSNSSTFYVA